MQIILKFRFRQHEQRIAHYKTCYDIDTNFHEDGMN